MQQTSSHSLPSLPRLYTAHVTDRPNYSTLPNRFLSIFTRHRQPEILPQLSVFNAEPANALNGSS